MNRRTESVPARLRLRSVHLTAEALSVELADVLAEIAVLTKHVQLINDQVRALPAEPPQVSTAAPAPEPDRILSTAEVLKATSFRSRVTLWSLEKKGQFPRRISLSANRIGYASSAVAQWMKTRSEVSK